MNKEKHVIILGGIHGSGKTTVCQSLQDSYGIMTTKQAYEVIEAGNGRGFDRTESLVRFGDFIDEASERLCQKLSSHRGHPALLIDGHYSISKSKALRRIKEDYGGDYIPDINERFVDRLAENFRLTLILCMTDPEIARKRIERRGHHLDEFENTLTGLSELRTAEEIFFRRLSARYSGKVESILQLDFNADMNSVRTSMEKVIL